MKNNTHILILTRFALSLFLLLPVVISHANQRPPINSSNTGSKDIVTTDANTDAEINTEMADDNIRWGNHWYIGAGVVKQSPSTIQARTTENGSTQTIDAYSDSEDRGWTVLVGKQLASYFAAELSYVDIGGGTASNDSNSVLINYDSAYAVEGRGIFSTPKLYGFNLLAIFGVDYISQSGTQTDSTGNRDFHYNATTYFIGAGAQYDYQKFGLRFDWTNIQVRANSEDDVSIQSLYTLSLLYRIN